MKQANFSRLVFRSFFQLVKKITTTKFPRDEKKARLNFLHHNYNTNMNAIFDCFFQELEELACCARP